MQTMLLSSKGQVIIPKAVREARRWSPGTRLTVQETREGVLLKPAASPEKAALHGGLAAIRSRVNDQGRAISFRKMDAAVLREASRPGSGRKTR